MQTLKFQLVDFYLHNCGATHSCQHHDTYFVFVKEYANKNHAMVKCAFALFNALSTFRSQYNEKLLLL